MAATVQEEVEGIFRDPHGKYPESTNVHRANFTLGMTGCMKEKNQILLYCTDNPVFKYSD